jgi:hypothetical protein
MIKKAHQPNFHHTAQECQSFEKGNVANREQFRKKASDSAKRRKATRRPSLGSDAQALAQAKMGV